jgi:N-acetylneuraminic acid mutarotase
MAPKRARTEPRLPTATAAPKITLSGGEAHHSSLVALWRQEKLTDIAVCAEGVEFKAHRAVLAASSGYFLSLFDSGMRDAETATHAIEGLRSPVLETLLAFVYEGSCQVEEGLLTEMLDASARLVVDPLKAACARAIQSQLGPCNALDVWRLADLYTLPALEKAAVDSALGGFEELPLQSASGAQVLALVQEDRLVAKNEEAVFQWVVRWWEAAERPEAELLAVMKHVRFADMDTGFVQTTVRAWPALDSKEGRDIILDAVLDAGCALRRSGFGPHLVYVLGGSDPDNSELSMVHAYDPRTDAWKQLASMPTGRHLHGGAALDGKIYLMGGLDGVGSVLSSAAVYDSHSDSWQPLAEMASGRARFAAAAADGKIYAIGGNTSAETTATVEAFDPLLGAWAEVASMSVARCHHAVAVVDGKIYAIGGFDDDFIQIDSVEMYDPQANRWQQMASIPQIRSCHAAAAMAGKIYVTGGDSRGGDGSLGLSTAVVFDPQANAWAELTSMGAARQDHASTAIGGKLYVFGGFDSHRLASVEAYDPISNTWVPVAGLRPGRDESVAVAL